MKVPEEGRELRALGRQVQTVLVQTTPLLIDLLGCEPERIGSADDAPIFNASVVLHADTLVACTRCSTGVAIRDKHFTYRDGLPHDTVNHLHFFDIQGELLRSTAIDDSATRRLVGHAELGLEDIRLFSFRGHLHGMCAGISRAGDGLRSTQILVRFSDHVISHWRVLPSPVGAPFEKNWMPLVAGDRLLFVYSLEPMVLIEPRHGALAVVKGHLRPGGAFALRGGTPFIRIGNKYLALAHYAPIALDKLYYRHCFVVLDEKFDCVEASEPFFIQRRGIEFAAGLTRIGDELVLGYGVADQAAFLLRFELRALRRHLVSLAV